jgi:hypothetical protein
MLASLTEQGYLGQHHCNTLYGGGLTLYSPSCREGVSPLKKPRRRPDRLCDVGAATPTIELEGDQLG